MRSKKSHLNKSSATGVAAVRLLPRVNAGVSLQVGRPVELSTAHVAAVRLVACQQIIQQRLETHKMKWKQWKRQLSFSLPEPQVLVPWGLPE